MRTIDVGKGLRLFFLPAKGLHNVHARHMLLDKLIDFRDPVANIHKGTLDVFLEDSGCPKQHRDGQQDDQGQ